MTTENNDTIFTCPVICWILAAGAGLILLIIMASGLGLGAFWSILFSIAMFVAVGWFLTGHYCEAADNPASRTIAASRQSVVAVDRVGARDLATAPDAPKSAPRVSAKPAAKKASKPAAKKPATKKAPAKTAAKKAGTAKTASKPAAKPATKPAAKKAPAKAAAKKATTAKTAKKPAAKPAAKKTTAKPAAKKAPAKAAAKPAATKTTGKPGALKAARGGKADNLKQIKGVGPALEKELHKHGFFHFDQIAGWSAAQVKWADDNLKGVRDRVSRDGWVAQAKVLAKGGETEFSKRVKKGDVY